MPLLRSVFVILALVQPSTMEYSGLLKNSTHNFGPGRLRDPEDDESAWKSFASSVNDVLTMEWLDHLTDLVLASELRQLLDSQLI